MLNYFRDKIKGAYRGGKGEKSLRSDPGSKLRPGREKKKTCEDHVDGTSKKEKECAF